MTRFPEINTPTISDISASTALSILIATTLIIVGEGLLFLGLVIEALWIYVFAVLVFSIIPYYFRATVPIFSGFVLLPVFRLVNLAMPVFVDLTIYWILLVYSPFFIAGVYFLWQSELIGFGVEARKMLLWLPIALLGGIGLAEFAYRVDPAALLTPTVTTSGLALITGVVVLGAVVEEILFRGILQSTLGDPLHSWIAVAVASVIYAVMRTPMGHYAVGVAFVAGLAFGVSYARSESLFIPIVFHSSMNALLFAVLPVYGSLFEMAP